MSLGSRIAKRGRVAVKASLISTPREPLLFLYPQWGRNSSSAAPKRALDGSNTTIITEPPKTKNQRALNLIQDPKSSRIHIDASTVRIQTRSQPVSAKAKDHSTPVISNGSGRYVKHSKKVADFSAIQRSTSTSINSKDPAFKSPVVNLDVSDSQPSTDEALHVQPLSTIGTATLRGSIKFETLPDSHESSTVLGDVEKMVDRIMRANESTRISQLSARSIREDFQTYRREASDNWTADWRKVLESLVKNTPQDLQWHEKQIQIVVPPVGTRHLLSGADNSIRDIAEKYGCSVTIEWRRHNTEQNQGVFVLSGSKSAMSRTLADVLLIAPDAHIMANDQCALSAPQTSQHALVEPLQAYSVRPVVSAACANKFWEKPEEVPRPSEWTQDSLLDYVRHLTRTRKDKKVSYSHATADILTKLFRDPDPDLRTAITRTVCHEALRFLVAANRIMDVRVLVVRMELFQLPLVPETFNIMLRGVAKNRDIHNFHFILHLMFKRGFKANGHTWIAFMMAMEDSQMKIHAAIAMKSQGLLMHKSIMKGVCEQLVRPEIELSLDAGQDQETFVSHMDSRYGRDWLSSDSGNRVLDVLGSRGLISRCWDFLHFMDSRFKYPDQYSINTILNHCKQTHNLAGAIELMQNISPAWGFQPNQETFRILFRLAYDTRMVNVAKVVWKYACIAGLIDPTMQNRVTNSMRAAWLVPYTPRHRWAYYSGSIIFGTYGGLHPVRTIIPNASTEPFPITHPWVNWETVMNETAPIARLNGIGPFPPNPLPLYKPHSYVHLPFKTVAPWVLEQYYQNMREEFQFDLYLPKYIAGFSPRFSFEKMLGDAWAQDRQWREDGTYRDARLRWMIAKAIRIPLRADAGRRTVILL